MNWREFEFPKTPYIFVEVEVREDKSLGPKETDIFTNTEVIIQEKVDGNNLAIFVDEDGPHYKSRGSIVTPHDARFKNLNLWYNIHEEEIKSISEKGLCLIGEWAFWKHTIHYQSLPSYFIAYDIFDLKNERFLSQKRVIELLSRTSIAYNPIIYEGKINGVKDLEKLLDGSQFGAPKKEGLYLRIDDEDYNLHRAKYVPKEFIEGINTHWRPTIKNKSTNEYEKEWS
ncbi:MAG: RNA ligase family protein [Nanoarchaeota archaeon]|nr:RNA ligase family protein [Nanoarchaeota archaeon]